MYLKFAEKIITNFSDNIITPLYNEGYVFTRVGKGIMNQTRSLRIDLAKFELSSENRRVLKKTDDLTITSLSLPWADYNWQIGKMAKDFYDTKFGDKTFSANKIKELLTNDTKSNFNLLFAFSVIPSAAEGSLDVRTLRDFSTSLRSGRNDRAIGYAICRETNELLHYSYPFYNLKDFAKDTGLGMMIRAILWAKEQGKKYIYLGSASRPTDTYKLQFKGIEWFDGTSWSDNFVRLKTQLSS